jgi:hypothetical protein
MALWDEKEQSRIRGIARVREDAELEELRNPTGNCIGCKLWREKDGFKIEGMAKRKHGINLYKSKKRDSKHQLISGYCFRPSGICEPEVKV